MTDRGRTMLLVGSLLCNGLLAGFVLGQFRGEAFARSALRHAQEMTSVPSSIDTVINGAFDTERLTIEDALHAARIAQDDAAGIVRHDPLDLDRLDDALARIRSADDTLLTAVHHALRSAAAKLDPKGRDVVADVLDEGPPSGRGFAQQHRWTYLRRLLD